MTETISIVPQLPKMAFNKVAKGGSRDVLPRTERIPNSKMVCEYFLGFSGTEVNFARLIF